MPVVSESYHTEAVRGDYVARQILQWLSKKQRVHYVPWVLDPTCPSYDHDKVIEDEARHGLLNELEQFVKITSENAIKLFPITKEE